MFHARFWTTDALVANQHPIDERDLVQACVQYSLYNQKKFHAKAELIFRLFFYVIRQDSSVFN